MKEIDYKHRKNMTFSEKKADIEKGTKIGLERIEQIRREKGD